jgi:F1F0 ATPase subunit 2
VTSLCWLVAGTLSGAFYTLTLWWTVSALRPKNTVRALLLAWGGALLRSTVVAVVLTAAASHALYLALLAFAGFMVARFTLTRLIWRRLIKPELALPN